MSALKYLFSASIVLFIFPFAISDPNDSKVYPVPPINENSLFYIQRTKNTNAIVYETNRLKDGKINTEEPVRVYWIRYASDSTTSELTPIQRRYAYGVESRIYNGAENSFVLKLVAYKKLNIYLLPADHGKRYAAYTNINGKFSEIRRIFVSTSGGTFWFPKVNYVELMGKDPVSKQTVIERFIPKR
jgi:hypothetical protein